MQTVNHEALRILVADIGYTETSARTGFKRDTLYKWGQRKGWKTPIEHAQSKAVQSVQSPSVAHAELLAERKNKSAAHLSKYIEEASEQLANSKGDLKHSRPGKDIVAMRSGIWPEQQGQAAFSLNVLNLGGSVQIGVKADSGDAVAQPHSLIDSSETD